MRGLALAGTFRERAETWAQANGVTAVLLSLIVVFALAVRLENVNWDQSQHLHPDERFLSLISAQLSGPSSIGNYFDSGRSELNPYNHSGTFVYGTFPLFLNKAVASWLARSPDGSNQPGAGAVLGALKLLGVHYERPDGYTFDGGYNSNLVGRVLSALFDVGTVVLLFELGRVLYSRGVGLLAGGLMSTTVLNIQYSHFFGSETFLAFFVTATIYFSVRIWKFGGAWNYAFAGLVFGLALACKLSALPAVLLPAIAIALRAWPEVAPRLRRSFTVLDRRDSLSDAETGKPRPREPGLDLEVAGSDAGAGKPRPSVEPPERERIDWPSLGALALRGLLLLFVAGLTFRVAQPYAFQGPGFFDVFDIDLTASNVLHLQFLNPTHYVALSDKFVKDINGLIQLQNGGDFPPNIQWIGRTRFLFPAGNILFWGLGIPLSIAFAAGAAITCWRIVFRRDLTGLLLIFWVGLTFWFNARGFVPTMRYFISLYPAAVLLGAYGLSSLWNFAESGAAAAVVRRWWPRPSGRAGALQLRLPEITRPEAEVSGTRLARWAPVVMQSAVVVIVAAGFLWSMAFAGVYRQQISRLQASLWIGKNVAPGSVLSFEEWDDPLPLNIPGSRSDQYKSVTLKPYLPDNPEKVTELISGLDKLDYIIESSNRLYDTIPRIPARYPSTVAYYRDLFNGSLGFERVAEFHNYPQLFGINVHDQWAEEAFSVYDHPKVTIWRKTPAYSSERAVSLLQPAKAAAALNVPPGKSATNALMLRPDDLAAQREGGTWKRTFYAGGLATGHPALLWLLVLELAGAAAAPLMLLLARNLPDRGYLLAKPLGLLLLGWLVWLGVSLKIVHFERTTIATCLILLLALAYTLGVLRRHELVPYIRRNWRLVLLSEVVFIAAFLVFYEFRLINPDLWHPNRGGEKPMDLAYLTAVTRSTTLPPYDPWFAGGYINYYYLGQFFTATVTKLTGITPEVAFNLAVPTYFALTAAAVFSVAFNLAAATRRFVRRSAGRRAIPGWSAIAAGLLGAVFVCVVGNLDGVGQMADRLAAVSTWHVHMPIPVVGSVVNSANGLWQVVLHGVSLRPFDYWQSSRMLSAPEGQVAPITEFPYFTFLFADLHAHMMAIAFGVLAIGGSLGLALGGRGERMSLREWLLVALLGLVCGSLRWLNSWDYPTFLLLAIAAIVIGEREMEGGVRLASARAAGKAVLLVALSFILYWPFLRNYSSPVSGVHASQQTTALAQYIGHFGLFLAPITAWLVFQLFRALRRTSASALLSGGRKNGINGAIAAYEGLTRRGQVWCSATVAGGAVLIILAGYLFLEGKSTIAAMLPALAVVAYLALRELRVGRADAGPRLFVLALLGLGFGLSLGVDLVTLNGDITRMNTVFKFYIHAWVVFGLAASYCVWYFVFVLGPAPKPLHAQAMEGASPGRDTTAGVASSGGNARPGVAAGRARLPSRQTLRLGGAGVLALLLVGAGIYPVMATPERLKERFVSLPKTLDGAAYMAGATYQDAKGPITLEWDYEGIQWLRANVEGTPAIMEGRSDLYSWSSRFSIYTGLPAVLGWDWHQKQQRGDFGGPVIDKRAQQVDDFYANPDAHQALKTLSEYEVRYVIVGQLEQLHYPAQGLAKFKASLEGALEVAFQNAGLTIYEVRLTSQELALRAYP